MSKDKILVFLSIIILSLSGACSNSKSAKDGAVDNEDTVPGTGAETETDSGAETGTESGSDTAVESGSDTLEDDSAKLQPVTGANQYVIENNDLPSNGGTMTFTGIGAEGWYPSRRDPASGLCDVKNTDECCLTKKELTGDQLAPWNEDITVALRGPMVFKQIAVYQPDSDTEWNLVSLWDQRDKDNAKGLLINRGSGFSGSFSGFVGNTCVYDMTTDQPFPCNEGGDMEFCTSADGHYWGWKGSKMFIFLASAPYYDSNIIPADVNCLNPVNDSEKGGWHDAPWIGLGVGELLRAGSWGGCNCFAKNGDEWWLADGCGQINVWEIVNDNNSYTNFELFSTNFIGYQGYIGYGPPNSRTECRDEVKSIKADVDLALRNDCSKEVSEGSLANPDQGPEGAFKRPAEGYRYWVILMDAASRSVQLAIIHPDNIPSSITPILPGMPDTVTKSDINNMLTLRLPH